MSKPKQVVKTGKTPHSEWMIVYPDPPLTKEKQLREYKRRKTKQEKAKLNRVKGLEIEPVKEFKGEVIQGGQNNFNKIIGVKYGKTKEFQKWERENSVYLRTVKK